MGFGFIDGFSKRSHFESTLEQFLDAVFGDIAIFFFLIDSDGFTLIFQGGDQARTDPTIRIEDIFLRVCESKDTAFCEFDGELARVDGFFGVI